VYRISQDKPEHDGIHPGWNADYTALLPIVPITRRSITNTSESHWECISDFLGECLRNVTEKRSNPDSFPKDAREFLASLPSHCYGPERLLSRALYRLAYDETQADCIRSVYRLADQYGREITLEHLLILPEDAYQWILGGFAKTLLQQASMPGDDLVQACLYLGHDMKGGTGYQDLAPKTWAASFLREAHQRRPLPPK
jgi:hypothetical protein